MIIRICLWVVVLATATPLMACTASATVDRTGDNGTETSPEEGDLEAASALRGLTWKLVEYGSPDDLKPVLAGGSITVAFDADKVSGSAGCNSYSADYVLDDQNFTVAAVTSTAMVCEGAGLMEQEAAYLAALRSTETFTVNGDMLTIAYDGGLLRFTSEPLSANASLVGPLWQLTTFVEGDVAESLVPGVPVTVGFAQGRVAGSGGCNQYGANYTVANDTITIGEVVATKMACMDNVTAQENRFFATLASSGTFTIEGDILTLTHPGGALIFTAISKE